MSYDDIKAFCTEAGKNKEFIFLNIDRSKRKCEVKYFLCIENKNTFLESVPESNISFDYHWKKKTSSVITQDVSKELDEVAD